MTRDKHGEEKDIHGERKDIGAALRQAAPRCAARGGRPVAKGRSARPTRRCFVYFVAARRAGEVALSPGVRDYTRRLLREMERLVVTQQMPAANRHKERCRDCEYRRFCLTAFAPVVFDLKFGGRRDFHRLTTTAYALVLGSLHEYPVDVGCVIYVRFAGDRVLVERDLHLIDDELRQWFIDERDERMRMVAEELDPGKADDCAEDCPHAGRCRRG